MVSWLCCFKDTKTNISRLLLRCVLTAAATALFLSMFIVFLPTFCQKSLGFDKVTTSVYVLLTIVTYAVSALAGGYLGDIIGNKKTQALGIILAIIIFILTSLYHY